MLFACADFSRSCADQPTKAFPPTGESVAYYRCRACGFLFTPHFDGLSASQMAAKIYNSDYIKADPDFSDTRPRYFAGVVRNALEPGETGLAALDFGGGEGRFAALMRDAGFCNFASYDPFFGDAPASASAYDLITAFEVVEHTRDPIGTFREMLGLLRPDGGLLFSTLLQPARLDQGWWYLAPRNGHVSLHCWRSLRSVARRLRVECLSINEGLHLFYRSPANAATRCIVGRNARPILRFASLNGMARLLDAGAQLTRLGQVQPPLDPRHAVRALMREFGRRME